VRLAQTDKELNSELNYLDLTNIDSSFCFESCCLDALNNEHKY